MRGFVLEIVFIAVVTIHSVESNSVASVLEIKQRYEENYVNNSVSIVSRIVNGEFATDGQFPYMVKLLLYAVDQCEAARLNCGGSIIAKNWVLTAGHCTAPSPGLYDTLFVIEIRAGTILVDEPRQRRTALAVTHVFPHPDYNSTSLENDIGLIKTATYFDFSTPYVQPIPLVAANIDKASYVGQIVMAMGFGYITPDGPLSNELRYTPLRVIDFQFCRTFYDGEELPASSFCARADNQISGTCSGDSGSPITLDIDGKVTQVGLVSYSNHDIGCNNGPGGYTSVSLFIPWIKEVMAQHK